jgi:hypothetical protein
MVSLFTMALPAGGRLKGLVQAANGCFSACIPAVRDRWQEIAPVCAVADRFVMLQRKFLHQTAHMREMVKTLLYP